ncbi:MAG: hypothetical protein WCX73_00905 [Candidatus Pacearchaeota archaeon]|jgi:hypothetical protein
MEIKKQIQILPKDLADLAVGNGLEVPGHSVHRLREIAYDINDYLYDCRFVPKCFNQTINEQDLIYRIERIK